jgi:hypothetical protein
VQWAFAPVSARPGWQLEMGICIGDWELVMGININININIEMVRGLDFGERPQ